MGAFPSSRKEAMGALSALPLECLADIMEFLVAGRDLFAFAKTCRRATRALGQRPLKGLPVLFVSRVTLFCGVYFIEYQGLAAVDVLPASPPYRWEVSLADLLKRPRALPPNAVLGFGETFAQRRRTHFIVVYTRDHLFLVAWCGAFRR